VDEKGFNNKGHLDLGTKARDVCGCGSVTMQRINGRGFADAG